MTTIRAAAGRGTVVVAGSMAQRAGHGGHAWVFLQYLLGFRRLGWDVLFLDHLEPGMCTDQRGRPCAAARSEQARYVSRIMDGFGLDGAWSVLHGDQAVGLPRAEVLRRVRRSKLFLNVMGYLKDEDVLGAAELRVFLDIDPGFGQMWRELGLADLFGDHHRHVTIGLNIGRDGCEIPTGGIDWLTTPPPVFLQAWPERPPVGERFTSVASWRGPFGPITYRGRTYGLRVHEFRHFLELPARTGQFFELALDIHPGDADDTERLRDAGFELVDPRAVAGDPWRYRSYVQGSRAELQVAKQLYVATRSGWISDRSLCYLASGRPVVAQDTGVGDLYPVGKGLLSFTTLDEAAEAVEQVEVDYGGHARAARSLAEEWFDSDRVLAALLRELAVT